MASISKKYRRRAERVDLATDKAETLVGNEMIRQITQATQVQLYDRTPLKVTYRMFNSIGVSIVRSRVIGGYNRSGVISAPYAVYRLAMTGISKLGGHLLDMNPAEFVAEPMKKRIARVVLLAQRRIIGR